MPRNRRRDYLRDRAERRNRERNRDRNYYPMGDYDYGRQYNRMDYARRNESRSRDEGYPMDYERYNERYSADDYDMRGDYARRGIGRPREYNRRRNYRDYADDDYEMEYEEDLKDWIEKLKQKDRFNQQKDQVIQKAKEMKVDFKDYDENEFYAVYLMQVSDYPFVSNDARVYMNMAKAWLEDDDVEVEPSEKLCKYLYEIVLNEEDED